MFADMFVYMFEVEMASWPFAVWTFLRSCLSISSVFSQKKSKMSRPGQTKIQAIFRKLFTDFRQTFRETECFGVAFM